VSRVHGLELVSRLTVDYRTQVIDFNQVVGEMRARANSLGYSSSYFVRN
jgi:hypothetical protein